MIPVLLSNLKMSNLPSPFLPLAILVPSGETFIQPVLYPSVEEVIAVTVDITGVLSIPLHVIL